MSEVKKIKSFICPHCKEKQTTVLEWQTVSVASEFYLDTGMSEFDVDHEGGEHESWTCPGCGEDLPENICEQISKTLFG